MPFLFAIDAAYFLIAAVGGRSPPPLVASPGTSASPPSLRAASLPMTVRIVRVPCRFGGTRPYFICPGVVNGTCRSSKPKFRCRLRVIGHVGFQASRRSYRWCSPPTSGMAAMRPVDALDTGLGTGGSLFSERCVRDLL